MAIRLLAAGAWGRMRRAFLGVFSSQGCLHTGFWAKGRHCGPHPVKNDRSLRHWGPGPGHSARFCTPAPAPADPGMLNTPEFARRPLGHLWAKSNRPTEICIWRGSLCKNTAVGASAARQNLNPRTGYSALLRAPTMSILLRVRLVVRLTINVKTKESTTAST